MKKSRYIVAFFFVVNTFTAVGQVPDAKEVINRVMEYYKNVHEYHITMNFNLFRGKDGKKSSQFYQGFMEKKGTFHKNTVGQTQVFQFKDHRMILDKAKKTIQFSNEGHKDHKDGFGGLNALFENYNQVKIASMNDAYWICEFSLKNQQFTQMQYDKVVLHIHKERYNISKQLLYFAAKVPFSENGKQVLDYGRMEITIKEDTKREIKRSKISDYLILDGQQHIAKPPYQHYEVKQLSK